MLAESLICLIFSRSITLLLPLRYFAWMFGAQGRTTPTEIDVAPLGRAAAVGRAIERVARKVPFRAVCLEQAIAARLMLGRRRIASTLYLGVQRDREKRHAAGTSNAAHAWVRVGPLHVVGGQDVSDFIVISSFS